MKVNYREFVNIIIPDQYKELLSWNLYLNKTDNSNSIAVSGPLIHRTRKNVYKFYETNY